MNWTRPIRRAKPRALAALGAGILVLATFGARRDTQAKTAAPPVSLPPQIEWRGQLRSASDVTGPPSRFKRLLQRMVGASDTDAGMVMPYGIAVDSKGRVLVADTRTRLVHIFDPASKRYRSIRAPDDNPFLSPISVALDAGDNIYVSDSERSRIFVFRPDGKYLREIGALSRDESIFKRATGIAIDTRRSRLYVADTIAMQVVILSLEGQVIRRLGQRGVAAGQFNYPTQIAVAPDGSFWVTDSLNFRVQHFSGEGEWLNGFGRLGDGVSEFDKPKGIAVDAQGNVLVVEGRHDRVQVYSPQGNLKFFFGGTGRQEGQFFLPTGIAVDRANYVYVADSYNSRVEIFRLRSGSVDEIRR